jgi:uncharacterized protein
MRKWLKLVAVGLAGLGALTVGILVILIAVTKLPGKARTPSGLRRDTALYIKMRDGVQIAADVWLPQDYQAGQRLPVLMRTTRYGRDGQFGWEYRLLVGLKQTDARDEQTDYLNARHFVVIIADARACGASSGHREAEFSREEISDLGELVNWAAQQPWSNGHVGTFGGSYEGTTAELAAAANAPALKAVAPFSSQFDMGRFIFPGGIYGQVYMQYWSDLIRRLDNTEDVCVTESLSGVRCWWAGRLLRGVKRVDEDGDGKQLAAILAQRHNGYPVELLSQSEFSGDRIPLRDGSSVTLGEMSAFGHRREIESSHVAMQVWCGWLDTIVCEGALSRYLTFKNPQQVIIGAFSHELTFNSDPFLTSDKRSSPDPTGAEQNRMMADFFDRFLRSDVTQPIESGIRYYTMGEHQWHETKVWPPPGFESRSRLYFATDHLLNPAPPVASSARDAYTVNFAASTGEANRWSTVNQDLVYPERSAEDAKLLVYTGPPLATDVEISGSPAVTLEVASTATDGAFFAYLEDVAPDGRVTFLDDGQLRAVSRKLMDPLKLPYIPLGPASSNTREDAQPLVPGEAVELKFSMWPTSIMLQKGHRIRIALAGADNCFRRYPPLGDVSWTVYREAGRASYLELPMRPR